MCRCKNCLEMAQLGDDTNICLINSTIEKVEVVVNANVEIECGQFIDFNAEPIYGEIAMLKTKPRI